MTAIWWKCLDGDYEHLQPGKATRGSAAWDLFAMNDGPIYASTTKLFHTAWAVEIPEDHCGLVLPRSGLATKHGITVANSPGLIDSDYRGEIMVCLRNEGDVTYNVESGDRIAQLLVLAVPNLISGWAHELSSTERGKSGFGSSGR